MCDQRQGGFSLSKVSCSRFVSLVCLGPLTMTCWVFRDCDVSQINYMYAQYVKNTMQTLNIADVTKDQRFPWTVCTSLYFHVSSSLHLFPMFSTRLSSRDRGRIQITQTSRLKVCSALPSGTERRTKWLVRAFCWSVSGPGAALLSSLEQSFEDSIHLSDYHQCN